MLKKISTPDEKLLDDLSEVTKENRQVAKYTEGDFGDVKFYRLKSDANRKFMRVCETTLPPEGKSGAATYKFTLYECIAPLGASLSRSPLEVK